MKITNPVWLMQPNPYFGEKLRGEWIYEPKIEGWRLQTTKNSIGTIEFWGRRLEKQPDWIKKLSYLSPHIQDILPNNTILDCELSTNKRRRFVPSVFASKPKAEAIIDIFDVIYFDGKFMGNSHLEERKEILSSLNLKKPYCQVPFLPLKDIKDALT